MILTPNIQKNFSKTVIDVQCDHCKKTIKKPCFRIFGARKNSKSEIDICGDIDCVKWKRENTMVKRYGVINAGLSEALRNKVKQTCLKKYGAETPWSSKEIQEKIKKTCLEKYGTENVFSTNWCKEKIKQHYLQNFGTTHNMQVQLTKEKRKLTFLRLYGTEIATLNDGVKKKISRTHLKKIYNKLETDNIKPLFSEKEFNGFHKNKILYKFQCKKCGNIFENNYIGVQCYRCNPLPRSKIEEDLSNFLNTLSSNIIRNNRKSFDNKFEIDFFLPTHNLAIELNGNYYHSEIAGKKSKEYHREKTEFCEKRGIHLIHIFEDEWRNNSEIIKEKLSHILKKTIQKIYARQCIIKSLSFIESKLFFKKNHIQGSDMSPIRFGLYHNNQLVAAMTFSKLRKIMGFKSSNQNGVFELSRYASIGGFSIIGGAGKLLSYFIKHHRPTKIISYADRRWSTTGKNMYVSLGFKLVSKSSPNYWYVHSSDFSKRFYRFTFRKSELHKKLNLFDPILTEWQNMQLNGYDRIWDCGNLRYELNI